MSMFLKSPSWETGVGRASASGRSIRLKRCLPESEAHCLPAVILRMKKALHMQRPADSDEFRLCPQRTCREMRRHAGSGLFRVLLSSVTPRILAIPGFVLSFTAIRFVKKLHLHVVIIQLI